MAEENIAGTDNFRNSSGRMGQHSGHGEIVPGCGFPENLPGGGGTTATLTADPQLTPQLAYRGYPVFSSFPDIPVGYTGAQTYVHGHFPRMATKNVSDNYCHSRV